MARRDHGWGSRGEDFDYFARAPWAGRGRLGVRRSRLILEIQAGAPDDGCVPGRVWFTPPQSGLPRGMYTRATHAGCGLIAVRKITSVGQRARRVGLSGSPASNEATSLSSRGSCAMYSWRQTWLCPHMRTWTLVRGRRTVRRKRAGKRKKRRATRGRMKIRRKGKSDAQWRTGLRTRCY